jgi:hypothetical protein
LPFQLDQRGTNPQAKRKFFAPRRNHPVVGQSECGADHGMPGELHLVIGSEDAQPHIGAGRFRRLDERALRELRFARHRLHFRRRQPGRLHEDGQLVAGQRLVCENIVVTEAAAIDHGGPSDWLSRRGVTPGENWDGCGHTQQ